MRVRFLGVLLAWVGADSEHRWLRVQQLPRGYPYRGGGLRRRRRQQRERRVRQIKQKRGFRCCGVLLCKSAPSRQELDAVVDTEGDIERVSGAHSSASREKSRELERQSSLVEHEVAVYPDAKLPSAGKSRKPSLVEHGSSSGGGKQYIEHIAENYNQPPPTNRKREYLPALATSRVPTTARSHYRATSQVCSESIVDAPKHGSAAVQTLTHSEEERWRQLLTWCNRVLETGPRTRVHSERELACTWPYCQLADALWPGVLPLRYVSFGVCTRDVSVDNARLLRDAARAVDVSISQHARVDLRRVVLGDRKHQL
ncbi:MAG: hypothetical protein MHM6MM_008438 [Cercozoa sp. M6MM]